MKVLNTHERRLAAGRRRVGALLDSLSSSADRLWPGRAWPPMVFDRSLDVGAEGGHGPVRYVVERYVPGESVGFRFTGPRGFEGGHRFEVVGGDEQACVLRHTLEMTARGPALLTWPLVFRPLHNALLEDALAQAEASLGLEPQVKPWSLWVRLLRRVLARGRPRSRFRPRPAATPDGRRPSPDEPV